MTRTDPARSARLCTALVAALACVAVVPAGSSHSTACTQRVEVVFWTGTADRERLAKAVAANKSPCAEYWLSIPPLAANKKGLRAIEDDRMRALGIHPVAEFTTGENTGWANWVNEPGQNRTWYDAGVEFRKAMDSAGYDVTAGETWLINEFDRSTARDAPRQVPDHDWPPARRADMRELMRGLYDGAPGMTKAPGSAEIGIHFRHQDRPNVKQYRTYMKSWLADSAFWADADRYLRWIVVENYPDTRLWAPPRSTLLQRSSHLEAYVFHLLELARRGPSSARTAKRMFERKFLPLVNGGWRARGGDQFAYVTGHGNTIVTDVQMRQFVSEQVYAMRRYALAHPGAAPAGRLGFSWQPCNRLTATEAECRPPDPAFNQSVDLVATRIAESIRYAYGGDKTPPAAACGRPGTGVNWCRGRLPGASFTEVWNDFRGSG